jgi:DNA replication protein DnaC
LAFVEPKERVPFNRDSRQLTDAILDRIVHRAHRIELRGPSLRRHLITAESPAA